MWQALWPLVQRPAIRPTHLKWKATRPLIGPRAYVLFRTAVVLPVCRQGSFQWRRLQCSFGLFGVVVFKKLRQYWQDTLDRPHVALARRANRVHHSLFRLVATASLCTTNDTGILSRRKRRWIVHSGIIVRRVHCNAEIFQLVVRDG